MPPAMRCPQQRLRWLTVGPTHLTLPEFLVPCFATRRDHFGKDFSTTRQTQSRVGMNAISVPPDVIFTFMRAPAVKRKAARISAEELASTITVEGPLGKLDLKVPDFVDIKSDEATRTHTLSVRDASIKHQKSMWGTARALIQNIVTGVSEGHSTILRLVGVGYRATIEDKAITKQAAYPGQKFVSLKVGYSHPIELGVPHGIKASTPQPTRILLEGCELQKLKQFAAEIREWRKPEPYKGKGIFVDNETIKLKAKKIK